MRLTIIKVRVRAEWSKRSVDVDVKVVAMCQHERGVLRRRKGCASHVRGWDRALYPCQVVVWPTWGRAVAFSTLGH